MRTDTARTYRNCVEEAMDYLRRHLDDPKPVESVGRVVGFSSFHFHRVFRGMVGESPGEFVRRLRLERAASRLLTTDDSIVDVAFDSGFLTHESFTRAFGAAFIDGSRPANVETCACNLYYGEMRGDKTPYRS